MNKFSKISLAFSAPVEVQAKITIKCIKENLCGCCSKNSRGRHLRNSSQVTNVKDDGDDHFMDEISEELAHENKYDSNKYTLSPAKRACDRAKLKAKKQQCKVLINTLFKNNEPKRTEALKRLDQAKNDAKAIDALQTELQRAFVSKQKENEFNVRDQDVKALEDVLEVLATEEATHFMDLVTNLNFPFGSCALVTWFRPEDRVIFTKHGRLLLESDFQRGGRKDPIARGDEECEATSSVSYVEAIKLHRKFSMTTAAADCETQSYNGVVKANFEELKSEVKADEQCFLGLKTLLESEGRNWENFVKTNWTKLASTKELKKLLREERLNAFRKVLTAKEFRCFMDAVDNCDFPTCTMSSDWFRPEDRVVFTKDGHLWLERDYDDHLRCHHLTENDTLKRTSSMSYVEAIKLHQEVRKTVESSAGAKYHDVVKKSDVVKNAQEFDQFDNANEFPMDGFLILRMLISRKAEPWKEFVTNNRSTLVSTEKLKQLLETLSSGSAKNCNADFDWKQFKEFQTLESYDLGNKLPQSLIEETLDRIYRGMVEEHKFVEVSTVTPESNYRDIRTAYYNVFNRYYAQEPQQFYYKQHLIAAYRLALWRFQFEHNPEMEPSHKEAEPLWYSGQDRVGDNFDLRNGDANEHSP